MSSFVVPALALLLTFGALSCDIVVPDKAAYNSDAHPPVSLALNIQDLRPGQHVAGSFWVTMVPPVPLTEIAYVALLVDDSLVATTTLSPYQIGLNTKLWPDGAHEIKMSVGTHSSPELGMLNLLEAPAYICSSSLIFDQTPPTPVVLDSAVWNAGSRLASLQWGQNNDSNFYAYIISKDGNFGPMNPPFMGAGIDTLFNRGTTTYIDSSAVQMYGLKLHYRVDATNRDVITPSNTDTLEFGPTIPVTPQRIAPGYLRPLRSLVRDEVYVLENSSLKALSTANNSVLREVALNNSPDDFSLSKDGSRIFVISTYSPKLISIDAGTFATLVTADLSFNPAAIECGRSNRLYMTTAFPFDGPVKVVNALTGGEIGDLGLLAPNAQLAASQDSNVIFIASPAPGTSSPAMIYRVDVTTDSGQITAQHSASDEVRVLEASADGQRLYVIHQTRYPAPLNLFVDIWNASTLTSLGHINTPDYPFDVVCNASSLYISFAIPGGLYFQAGRVQEYSIPSYSAQRKWDFVQVPTGNQLSRDGKFLYAYGFESWMIQLSP